MENNIVVYRHVRLDTNEVFYVGIGNEKRPYRKYQRSKFWNRIVNKTEYRVDILFDDLTWEKACEKEKEFIQLYGRRDLGLGTLVNLTDGGDGVRGLKHSKESRIKMSKSTSGKKNPMFGKKFSEEHKRKIGETSKGRFFSKEARKKISDANKDRFFSKEAREKLSKANKGKPKSKEHKRKLSEAKKDKNTIPIIQFDLNNNFIREWNSAANASKSLNIDPSSITKNCKGTYKTCGGFIFKYKPTE